MNSTRKRSVVISGLIVGLTLVHVAGLHAAGIAPAEKFIPSFAICYSDAKGALSAEETARFDLLLVSFSKRAARVWGTNGQNSWQTLKALNPNLTEFDPRYLHLGKALGPLVKRGQIHCREFEDGWVAVNGQIKDASGIRVPAGSARVLDHHNFKNWAQAPLVNSFDLPAHRGVVLLREGKQAGNADNLGQRHPPGA